MHKTQAAYIEAKAGYDATNAALDDALAVINAALDAGEIGYDLHDHLANDAIDNSGLDVAFKALDAAEEALIEWAFITLPSATRISRGDVKLLNHLRANCWKPQVRQKVVALAMKWSGK